MVTAGISLNAFRSGAKQGLWSETRALEDRDGEKVGVQYLLGELSCALARR